MLIGTSTTHYLTDRYHPHTRIHTRQDGRPGLHDLVRSFRTEPSLECRVKPRELRGPQQARRHTQPQLPERPHLGRNPDMGREQHGPHVGGPPP